MRVSLGGLGRGSGGGGQRGKKPDDSRACHSPMSPWGEECGRGLLLPPESPINGPPHWCSQHAKQVRNRCRVPPVLAPQNISQTPCQRARHCYRCERSPVLCAGLPNLVQHNTGNGKYEKTPRCPGGWSVRGRRLCPGPCSDHAGPCTCTDARRGTGSHGGSRGRSSPRSGSQGQGSQDQEGREKEDQQKGRQEEDRPHPPSRLILPSNGRAQSPAHASQSPAAAGDLL